MHSSLLRLAPYYALWYPGPLAKEFRAKEMRPRYKHDAAKLSLRTRGIDLSLSDVMMSDICKSADLHFVGISIYSPRYKAKAERLLRSCARVGICCKATELPATAFGADVPEGSEAFRFETIASKPSFILDQVLTLTPTLNPTPTQTLTLTPNPNPNPNPTPNPNPNPNPYPYPLPDPRKSRSAHSTSHRWRAPRTPRTYTLPVDICGAWEQAPLGCAWLQPPLGRMVGAAGLHGCSRRAAWLGLGLGLG